MKTASTGQTTHSGMRDPSVRLGRHHLHNRRWPKFERLCEIAAERGVTVSLTVHDGRMTSVMLSRENRPVARRIIRLRVDEPSCPPDLDAAASGLLALIPD